MAAASISLAASLSSLSHRPQAQFLKRSSLSFPPRQPQPPPSPLLSLRWRCTPPEAEAEAEAEASEQEQLEQEEQEEQEAAGMFQGPMFEWPDESEEELETAYERLYGPSWSGNTYLGGDVYHLGPVEDPRYAIRTKPDDDFQEKIIQVRRVTKVVKGGKNMSFRAVVAVGDKKGHVGVGMGKALDSVEAIVKAVINARQNIVTVPLTKHLTFPHRATAKYRAAEVMLRPAAPGSGVNAGGTVRAVLEMAGLQNALGKQLGSDNALNNARATIAATQQMRNLADVARERGIPMEELWK